MNSSTDLAVAGAKKMLQRFLQRWDNLDLTSVWEVVDEAYCDICTLIDEPTPGWGGPSPWWTSPCPSLPSMGRGMRKENPAAHRRLATGETTSSPRSWTFWSGGRNELGQTLALAPRAPTPYL